MWLHQLKKPKLGKICYSSLNDHSCSLMEFVGFNSLKFSFSSGPLSSGSGTVLHRRVPPDRLPPTDPSLQHHAAEQQPPRLTACPAGGGGGRRRPLPAPESRQRGETSDLEPL